MLFVPTIGTKLSGSLGGIVASHNRFGSYFRQRTVPVNPDTADQQMVRGYSGLPRIALEAIQRFARGPALGGAAASFQKSTVAPPPTPGMRRQNQNGLAAIRSSNALA